jgi:hypothetical protein
MVNIAWAMTTVAKPVVDPAWRNRPRSAAPSTTSGVASGRNTKKSTVLRPRKR